MSPYLLWNAKGHSSSRDEKVEIPEDLLADEDLNPDDFDNEWLSSGRPVSLDFLTALFERLGSLGQLNHLIPVFVKDQE